MDWREGEEANEVKGIRVADSRQREGRVTDLQQRGCGHSPLGTHHLFLKAHWSHECPLTGTLYFLNHRDA